MRLYRVYNLTELGPASGLLFFKREDAEKYKELVKWPYVNDGRWPLSGGGSVPLNELELRVESLDMDVLPDQELDQVLWEQAGVLGAAPLLPGDCFDPDQWCAYSPADLANVHLGSRLELAWQALKRGAGKG